MEESILEFLGSELIEVLSPVSICMFLVVLLVSSLSPPSTSSSSPLPTPSFVSFASLVYAETPTDSAATKLTGAVENAAVFVLYLAVVTFVLAILYYYKFTNFLKYYMRFSIFALFLFMGFPIIISIIRHFSIDVDVVSSTVFMLNFAGVGMVAVLGGGGVPIVVTQVYTVVLGILLAAWYTRLPEWTTWMLLVALSVYDMVAVLAPGGPLKILLELMQSRDDDFPVLMYESRPRVMVSRGGAGAIDGLQTVRVLENMWVEMPSLGGNNGTTGEVEGERVGLVSNLESSSEIGVVDEERPRVRVSDNVVNEERPIVRVSDNVVDEERPRVRVSDNVVDEERPRVRVSDNVSIEMRNLSADDGNVGEREGERVGLMSNETGVAGEERSRLMVGGLSLGVGDFVFYSVLVGRAAMYDLMTVYACYLAIISGLACTLILLAVCRRPLPALPISIALGMSFYFLTRLLMEPFVVQTSTNLLLF